MMASSGPGALGVNVIPSTTRSGCVTEPWVTVSVQECELFASLVSAIAPAGSAMAKMVCPPAASRPRTQVTLASALTPNAGTAIVAQVVTPSTLTSAVEAAAASVPLFLTVTVAVTGCTALLAVFLVILWRGLRLVGTAPDDFGKYLALGVTTMIVVQAFMNMSVVLDLAPTKGIPLPMISYGGSSLMSTLISFGMLLSVSEQSG